ncbi:MAG: prepilin-type N-terminal cleavage/methylation domain-containing protein [bacterium]|nr:prepilin-type N-terminal cleavage/methylation domain-containing protein [bacterium]
MNLRQQKGFTLVEMLVALMISAIFFSIFVGVVLATFETLRSGDERTVAQQNARIGLNYIANDIPGDFPSRSTRSIRL